MKILIGFFFATAILAGASLPCAAQGALTTWDVGGVKREALIFAPAAHPSGKHPLIFAFHGHGGNMNGVSRMMGFQNLWPEAIVVYPQGLPTPSRKDPQGLRPGWQTESGQVGDRDLQFFDVMLADLKKKYAVDEGRIYSTGFSNGALFTFLLWAKRGKTFAAFGICAGALEASERLGDPRPVLLIAGQNDKVLPFEAQQRALDSVRQVNGATGPGRPCGPFCTLYPSTHRAEVMAIVHPGGHVFTPRISQQIAAFFQTH